MDRRTLSPNQHLAWEVASRRPIELGDANFGLAP